MKFIKWLSEETRGLRPILAYGILAAFLAISMSYLVTNALQNWGLVKGPDLSALKENPFRYETVFTVLATVVQAPLMEEFIFRLVPLALVISFISENPKFLLGTTIVFAVLFGSLHPYALDEQIQVAISGFLFGIIFLKCGGIKKSYGRGYVSAALAHSLTNIFVYAYAYWNYRLMNG